ncbi:DUF1080 domain-containing protein [Aurantibacter crassamenti]|uniref:3-keto-disaccharide hydrolase n=1 Tax=Aurantibacter crassamenti TaxID=1837375 RepID=UPI001939D4D1|nr:DUF1080 domain-containing protein [Aurantibacter crassamenti]MBM1105411.1 DUF1080 domain-containing protein [Aurantibacter crassamenti]
MKKLMIVALVVLTSMACKEKVEKAADKAIEEVHEGDSAEATSEWISLFDGSSLDAWQAYMGGDAPESWKIIDGNMVFDPPTDEERKDADGKKQSFNIVTKQEFTSFVLSLEWKISDTGNGGIFWGIVEDAKYKQPYHSALEIQVLDNDKHPDGKNGTSHQAGALYDLVSPSEDVTKPVGEWNTAVITIDHNTNKGTSVLNGVEVATFPVHGEELDALLKGSKFDGWDGFAKAKTGKIGLQDHGDVVAFRNIKIKEL